MMTNTLGICTWTLGINDLDQMMSTIKEMGLNAVQYCEPADKWEPHEVTAAAQKYDLQILIYDPFDCSPPNASAATEENAINYYKRAIDFAKELGVGQTLQGLSRWTINAESRTSAWQVLVKMTKALAEYAGKKQVPLVYEPCNLYEVPLIHTATEYQQLVDDSGCSDIQILMDSFHMNIGETDPISTLKNYGTKNAIFHVSDSNREGIDQGNINFEQWQQVLVESGFKGPTVFEFVLKTNPVNTPPRNEQEMSELQRQVRHSVQQWRSYLQQ